MKMDNSQNRIDGLAKRFALRLRELRVGNQLSQKQLANQLGVAESTYANWEQGRRDPSIYDIYNLLCCLEVEPNELFDYEKGESQTLK